MPMTVRVSTPGGLLAPTLGVLHQTLRTGPNLLQSLSPVTLGASQVANPGGLVAINVITHDMERLVRDLLAFPVGVTQKVHSNLRIQAFAMMADIRLQMPIDTGSAARSWGNPSAPQLHPEVDMQGVFKYTESFGAQIAEFLMGGNWYIRELERGRTHFPEGLYGQPERSGVSKQAPPGFIHAIVNQRLNELMRHLQSSLGGKL